MDVVTLGMAKADAAKLPTAETFALLTTRLSVGSQDAVLTVLGDSTGNESTEWVYLVTQWLGTQFPAYTVLYRLWNDTSKTYDAAVTVQTGTGPRTLTVYNGSTPGKDADYSLTNLAAQVPVAPQIVVVSYSHNSTGNANYRPILFPLTRAVSDNFPGAGIVVTAQNPRATTDADYANGLVRTQDVMALAASEGYGLVNVTQAFLNTPNFGSTLLNPDGLHPSAAGSQLWANVVKGHMRKSANVVPRTTQPRHHRIFVPAASFIAAEGTPVLGVYGSPSPFAAWSFDKDVQAAVIGSAEWPHSWQSVNAYAVWNVAAGTGHTGSDGCRWELGLAAAGANTVFAGPTVVGSLTQQSQNPLGSLISNGYPSNSAAWETIYTRFPAIPTYKGRPVTMRVRRVAADAADTLAETAYLQGIVIERAS